MFFEMATGDFLFDPRHGKDWDRDEDHLALMVELLGDLPPKEWALSGKYSKEYFTNSGKLKHIKSLKYWSLHDVLTQKYSMAVELATEFADFLLPMLRWEPRLRLPASEALLHRFVQLAPGEIDEAPCDSSSSSAPSGTDPALQSSSSSAPQPVLSSASPVPSTFPPVPAVSSSGGYPSSGGALPLAPVAPAAPAASNVEEAEDIDPPLVPVPPSAELTLPAAESTLPAAESALPAAVAEVKLPKDEAEAAAAVAVQDGANPVTEQLQAPAAQLEGNCKGSGKGETAEAAKEADGESEPEAEAEQTEGTGKKKKKNKKKGKK